MFPRVWAGFVLLLVGVTYSLWFPIGPGSDYPAVSLLSVKNPIASGTAIVLIFALIAVIVAPKKLCWSWWLVAASLLVSFLIDQHRLQPWAYQTAIYACVFASLPPAIARSWLIALAASVYIYSAAGKFDYQFAHTVGQDFLNTALAPFGGIPADWDLSMRAKIALAFPTIELAAGLGLLIPATRKFAAPIVILMHVSLLAMLGPGGLGHSTGVLIWNMALIAQVYFLIIAAVPEQRAGDSHSLFAILSRGLLIIALLAPLTERWGYWDHWTSWALYSPHNSRVDVEVHASAVTQFPESLQAFVETDTDGDQWHRLRTGAWSLEIRKVPIYPQARYQLALAHSLASRYELKDAIRLSQRSLSNRWTGRRQELQWLGQKELDQALNQFWLIQR
jgi:hypothetical protein